MFEINEILLVMPKYRAILFLLLLACCCSKAFAELQVGQAAPNIEGTLMNGKPFSLEANKGKVVLVHFWASWCEPCQEEMPLMEAYLEKNKSKGLEVLAISMDKPSELEQAKHMMHGYNFLFAEKKQMNYSGYGRIWRIPSTFVIDKQGFLRKNGLTGDPTLDNKVLDEVVTPLLSK